MDLNIFNQDHDNLIGFQLLKRIGTPQKYLTPLEKQLRPLEKIPYIENGIGSNSQAIRIFGRINADGNLIFHSDLEKIFEESVIKEFFPTPDATIPNMYTAQGGRHKLFQLDKIIEFALKHQALVCIKKTLKPTILDKLLDAGVFPYQYK